MEHHGTGIVDVVTEVAMRQHSRRGFLGGLGKAGLALVGVVAGLGIPELAGACFQPPGPCLSSCSPCTKSCCTGGQCCEVACTNNLCICSCSSAYGQWVPGSTFCSFVFQCSKASCTC